jgi:hypothetical protein
MSFSRVGGRAQDSKEQKVVDQPYELGSRNRSARQASKTTRIDVKLAEWPG